jgi:hypothetical protein
LRLFDGFIASGSGSACWARRQPREAHGCLIPRAATAALRIGAAGRARHSGTPRVTLGHHHFGRMSRAYRPCPCSWEFDSEPTRFRSFDREPIEVRKATLASILRKSRPGVRFNEHLAHDSGPEVFQHACKMGLEGIVSKRLGSRYQSGRSPIGSSSRTRPRQQCGERRRRIGGADED